MNLYMVLLTLAVAVSICPVVHGFDVFVFNLLGTGSNLTVHCKSSREDLGTHVLIREDHFNWGFRIGRGPKKVYECDMSHDNVNGHFTIFDENRDASRCGDNKCLWKVQLDGLFLYVKASDQYEKQFSWP